MRAVGPWFNPILQAMVGDHLVGCLLGTAVGDALGLPYEGLSRHRAAKLLGPPNRHRLILGRGMVSDDSEHCWMVAEALLDSKADPAMFCTALARRLRWWLLGLPAGVGFATLRSVLRMWVGVSPQKSGVFSAGNGPAMRAAILGVSIEDRSHLLALIAASSRVTHTDPKAEYGAIAVAVAARMARQHSTVEPGQYLAAFHSLFGDTDSEFVTLMTETIQAVQLGITTPKFAEALGCTNGVTGYTYHTVPVAIHAWLSHQGNFRGALMAVIECGGDTDTTAAIAGGIVGAGVGKQGIPPEWIEGLWLWPRSVVWIEHLASQLDLLEARHHTSSPAWGLIPRNLLFLLTVLFHGLRRLLPPY